MDRDERARLRALCEAATPGPWTAKATERGGDHHICAPRDAEGYRIVVAVVDAAALVSDVIADAALIAAARTAIPALLDALETAERERDEARGDFAEMRVDRDAYKSALNRAIELRIGDRAEARLDEREACAELAEKWLREVSAITQDTPADLADAIRARGTGGAR